jgi:hypothetical protein
MKTLLTQALELADGEVKVGHNVMVLVPDCTWTSLIYNDPSLSPLASQLLGWCPGCPDEENNERVRALGSVYIRCTTLHSGLKFVPLDTLILVAPDADTWNAEGEALARERLRTSLNPQVIKIGGDA